MLKFDWTINFGQIVTIVSLFFAAIAAYMNLVRRIDRIENNLQLIFDWFKANVIDGGNGAVFREYVDGESHEREDGGLLGGAGSGAGPKAARNRRAFGKAQS